MRMLCLISLLLVCCSCAKDEEVVKTFDLEKFDKIEFDDSFEVRFHTSREFRIVARGTDRFIDELEVLSRGDSILVENKVKRAWLRPESNKVVLDVYCDSISQIRANESCLISSIDTLRSDDLLLIVGSKLNVADLKINCTVFGYYNLFPCSGSMTFSGKANQLNIWNDALMEVDASSLTTPSALIENKSAATCSAHVTDQLRYSILNRGDIILSGNPPIIEATDTSGEGQLIILP